ncbi:MAG: hypothetical protein ACK5PW_00265 [Burkholderiales bacterium]
MKKFLSLMTIVLFVSACGESKGEENRPDQSREKPSSTGFRAECVVPGETPSQCLAYRLTLEPKSK